MKKASKVNGALVIEHDVPPPRCVEWGGITATLHKMSAGDSVLLQLTPGDPRREKNRRVWHAIAAKLHVKIATRTVDGGIRVWRIE